VLSVLRYTDSDYLQTLLIVVFYYLSASEIWPDKRDCLCWEGPYKRGTTIHWN